MRKQLRFSTHFVFSTLIGSWYLFSTLSGLFHPNFTTSDQPAFLNEPNDTIVTCIEDVPPPLTLTATDDNDPSFPKQVPAVESYNPNPVTSCSGGTITRTWQASDLDGNTTIIQQIITVLPDREGPVVDLPPAHDTVACGADDFDTWINTIRLQLSPLNANKVYDRCGMIASVDYEPKSFPPTNGPCSTRNVTFLLTDTCGNVTEWPASYTVLDREKPVFSGVPANQTLSCRDAVPMTPAVTATDNCDGQIPVQFQETVEPSADCPDYNVTITRRWSAVDACGNQATAVQVIEVRDDQGPTFTKPADIRITCSQDPLDLKITGDATNLSDLCDPAPQLSFSDQVIRQSCAHNRTIQRNWMATDACGNVTLLTQLIEVADDQAPSFTVPPDVTVSCDQVNNLDVTGRPSQATDNCDAPPVVVIKEEIVIQGNDDCPNQYEIRRIWRAEDQCGNATEKTQKIFVVDQVAPVMGKAPADLTLSCQPGVDPAAAFADWIARHGNAAATDNCSLPAELTWRAVNSGTNIPASLPPQNCSAGNGVLRRQAVDFIATDECGNAVSATATFTLLDNTPPRILNCTDEVVISTDPGNCTGTYSFRIPQVEESCGVSTTSTILTDTALITSNALPGQEGEVPVNPMVLSFSSANLLPLNTIGDGVLVLQLVNADAEEANEYFNILGEDGSLLGRTAPTDKQCGNSQTSLPLTRQQIEAWAADGVLHIRLEPFIPANQPGRFAVNALCDPPGRVEGELRFERRIFSGLSFQYRIGEGPKISMDPAVAAGVTLPQGVNLVTLFVTDCGGNGDSCTFFVRVNDREAPVLSCPADITVDAPTGACQATVRLPIPLAITDNCSAGGRYDQTVPSDPAAALLTFQYDPNLNDYIARDKVLSFSGVAANALGPATLTINFQGDFNTRGAFVRILGEDGNALGQTRVGDANCTTAGELTLSIPRATFNAWAADGRLDIRAEVNDITVPPGVKGDGINPCDPAAVKSDGDNDGVSYLNARLVYDNLLPAYYAEGATTLPFMQMQPPQVAPAHEFAVGTTTVYYVQADAAGNRDTCSFRVTVRDREAPVARCQPTTVFINPAGTGQETISAAEIDGGSSDNCRIDTMFISPQTFNCAQAGQTINVTLTVRDEAGNEQSCSTPVRIETLKPQPTATSGVCGNDTLYLFANPPPASGGIVFTYRWTGPKGFVSDKQNPVIPKVTSQNAGSYAVEITGITGCKATGTVEVAVEDLPLTPQLITSQDICVDSPIELTSSVVPVGTSVTYRWYRGVPPGGTLMATTQSPSYAITGPHAEGTQTFYLTVEAGGCVSAASSPVTVRISKAPQAVVDNGEITLCEGEDIRLGTPLSGAGITYRWTGPNGFTSTSQYPTLIRNAGTANTGVYKLIVSKNGCPSNEARVIVNVLPRPPQPLLSSNGPVCEGGTITLTTSVPNGSVYRWISPSLQEFSTTVNQLVIPNATQEIAGAWRVVVSQFRCNSLESPPFDVVVNPNPPTAAAASQNIVCEGDKLQLFASPSIPNAIYRWTGPSGYSSATQNPVLNDMTKTREGTYQVTITTAQGCMGTAAVTVVVQRKPVITAVSNDGPDCLSGPTDIRLAATVFPADPGTFRYRWTGPGGFTSSDSVAVIRNATEASNGNYQLVVTTAEGCVSNAAITTVAVANPPAAPAVPRISPNTPAPFCEGQTIQLQTDAYAGGNVVYNWNTPKGIIATTAPALDIPAAQAEDSGNYSVFVRVNGCASQVSGNLSLSINRTPAVSINANSPVCQGATLELRTQLIPGATYSWTGPGFTSNVPNPDIPNASPSKHNGTYALRATLNGCVSNLVTTEVRVTPSPTQPLALNNGPLCTSNNSAGLILSVDSRSATPGATYTWSGPNGVVVQDTTALSIRLNDLARYGNNTVPFTVQAKQNGCPSPLSTPTLVQLNTIPENRAFAGDDFTACEGFATELKATAPTVGTGRWTLLDDTSGVVAIANPDQAVTAVTGLDGGRGYTFRWTLSNGACVNYSSDEVRVVVTESELVDAGDDILACLSDDLFLQATPVMTNRSFWSQSDEQERLGVVIDDPANPATHLSGLEAGNLYSFTWTVVGGCGEVTDEVFVLISDPNPFAGVDKIACNEEGFALLEADEPTEGSRGRWSSMQPGISFSDPRKPNAIATGLQPGPNTLIWTIDDGICGAASRDTVVITFKNNPIARPDTVVVPFGREVTFDARINDFVPPGSRLTVIRPPERGAIRENEDSTLVYLSRANFVGTERLTYELCSEACNCSVSTVTFVVGEGVQCDIPTIFTPNNDGVNDFFVVPCLLDTNQYPNSQVIIFNRWGDEVFRSPKPYANDWRGTFNGVDLPVGTYFYLVDLGDGSKPLSGFITLQR